MSKPNYTQIAEQLVSGNNSFLKQVFIEHSSYCVNYLMKKYRWAKEDAEDLLMDAIIVLREQILKGKFKGNNIRGFLVTVARNKYLNWKKKKYTTIPFQIDQVEYYINKQNQVYNEDFNPLLKLEESNRLKTEEEKQVNAFLKAWETLSPKCKKLLNDVHLEGLKLKDLQIKLGYGSYPSIKSTKSRCFRELKAKAKSLLKKNPELSDIDFKK